MLRGVECDDTNALFTGLLHAAPALSPRANVPADVPGLSADEFANRKFVHSRAFKAALQCAATVAGRGRHRHGRDGQRLSDDGTGGGASGVEPAHPGALPGERRRTAVCVLLRSRAGPAERPRRAHLRGRTPRRRRVGGRMPPRRPENRHRRKNKFCRGSTWLERMWTGLSVSRRSPFLRQLSAIIYLSRLTAHLSGVPLHTFNDRKELWRRC